MRKVLEREFGISPKWVEEQSNTTQENASESAKILKNEGIKTIDLATHFWHMPRLKDSSNDMVSKSFQLPWAFTKNSSSLH